MTSSLAKVYRTRLGAMYHGDSLELLHSLRDESVNLILTSPPFALTRRKEYGNHPEDEYVRWFETFAEQFKRVLREDGSLVIDLGGAWMLGSPTRSLSQYKLLIALVEKFEFHLAEDFYWFNRAKLPGPRQWATIDRVRVKDAVNVIWWLGKSSHPKADNRKVLKSYSKVNAAHAQARDLQLRGEAVSACDRRELSTRPRRRHPPERHRDEPPGAKLQPVVLRARQHARLPEHQLLG